MKPVVICIFALFVLCSGSGAFSTTDAMKINYDAGNLLIPWFDHVTTQIRNNPQYPQLVGAFLKSQGEQINCWMVVEKSGQVASLQIQAENSPINISSLVDAVVRNSAPFETFPPSIIPSARKHVFVKFKKSGSRVDVSTDLWLRSYLDQETHDCSDLGKRAQSLLFSGNYAAAIALYDKAIFLDPLDVNLRLRKAVSCLCSDATGAEASELAAWVQVFSRPDFPNHKSSEEWKRAAVFAVMSYRKCCENELAASLLSESIGRGDSKVWPQKVLLYLDKKLTAKELLDTAIDNQTALTEAHCYIGFDSMLTGDKVKAKQHFLWIKEHSGSGSDLPETALATSLLKNCQ